MPNFYELLGLTAGENSEQVKAAYHRLAKSLHPDVNYGDAAAEKRFKEVNQAYEILSDPEMRAAYDLGLKHKHAESYRRVWNAMTVMAASFMITVGCGLYISLSRVDEFAGRHERTAQPESDNGRGQQSREQERPRVAEPLAKDGSGPTPSPADPQGQSAPPTPTPQTQRQYALHLYTKGMEQIQQGNVVAARQFFAQAAKAGSMASIWALAGTYDPVQLNKLKVIGVKSNFDAAREWYQKVGDSDAIAAAELAAREEQAAQDLHGRSKSATDLAEFRAAYLSGDGLAYVVIDEVAGEQVYRYGVVSRSSAQKDSQTYTLFTCDTARVFTPRKPEDFAALLKATVVKPRDARFAELDAKYLSGCPNAKSAIAKD
jgi:curved DNA-binding protein CbpA